MAKKATMTAVQVMAALRQYYSLDSTGLASGEWAGLPEFSLRPGAGFRRADLFLVRAWGGKPAGHERITIEIKVSRSDLLKELKAPHKMAPFEAVSHRVFFATPVGLIKSTDDFPKNFGILEVQDNGYVNLRKRSVRNPSPDAIDERSFVEAFRRASKMEARMCLDASDNDLNARLAQKEKELVSLRAKLDREIEKHRYPSREEMRKQQFIMDAIFQGASCQYCKTPLMIAYTTDGWNIKHASTPAMSCGSYS